MLDIKFIRENRKLIAVNNQNRKLIFDLDQLFVLDDESVALRQKVETLRGERNKRSKTKPTEDEIKLMRKLSDELADLEEILAEKEAQLQKLLYQLPNLTHAEVPVGQDETKNKIIRQVGEAPIFNFQPKEHWELGEKLGVIDLTSAAEITGARFAYLKGRLAELEFALISYTISVLTNQKTIAKIISENGLNVPPKPFTMVIPPVMIRPEVMHKMGRLEPREERYHIENDNLYLVGSAEHTLGPLLMGKTLTEDELPIRYLGFSTAFRREAGSYGKDTKGIFRVHQFDKLEMESFTVPENSVAEQDFFVAIQEYLMSALKIPYQVVLKCTGDMGSPDYREFDIEAWLPGQGKYRETHTADLMTDFQARRLGTRVKRASGEIQFIHMNDATAMAMSRLPIAIMENYQTADGHIMVPKVLQKYTGFDVI